MPPVGRPVDAEARWPAGEELRDRFAAEPVRGQPVRAVRHRDRDPRPGARPLPLEQGGEDLDERTESAGGEVGDLRRRNGRRGIGEQPRPPDVVDVVARAQRVPALRTEAGDRAEDGAGRDLQPETLEDAGAEAVEDHVRLVAERLRLREAGGFLEIEPDDLLAGVDRVVPRRRAQLHRIAVRRLDLHDTCSEPKQLPARVRPRQLAGEVDDEVALERLHGAGTYH